jgi:hypothetical protein
MTDTPEKPAPENETDQQRRERISAAERKRLAARSQEILHLRFGRD